MRTAESKCLEKALLPLAFLFGLCCHASGPQSNAEAGPLAPRSQVVVVEDSRATEAFKPKNDVVREMVDRGITHLIGTDNPSSAWLTLVNTQDVVGIKVYSDPGPNSGTRPAVARAVAAGLIQAGLPPGQIIIWDRKLVTLRKAGFFRIAEDLGVQVAGSTDAGYDETVFYDRPLLGKLVWGDAEFGKEGDAIGRKSYVSTLVTQRITKIINITPVMNHNTAGVTGNLFSLALGSVDNISRFESNGDELAVAIPELYAMPAIGDRVVLNISDALICQYEGEERSLLHYAVPLNQLRFSRDPVALDVLSIREIERQRSNAESAASKPGMAIYENAAALELGKADPKDIQVIYVR